MKVGDLVRVVRVYSHGSWDAPGFRYQSYLWQEGQISQVFPNGALACYRIKDISHMATFYEDELEVIGDQNSR